MIDDRAIVVTGLGVVSPIGIGLDQFREALRRGTVGIKAHSALVAGRREQMMAALVQGDDGEGLDGRQSVTTDFAVRAATEAMARAGLADRVPPRPFGLVLGGCQTGPSHPAATGAGGSGHGEEVASRPSRTSDVAAALTERWPVDHSVIQVNTACAASTTAIGVAMELLRSGVVEAVLCGGADQVYLGAVHGLSSLTAADVEPCAPYSRSTGMNYGEGAGFLVIETAASARRRGASPVAVLAGYGLSADAYHPVRPDPTGEGAALAIERALVDAGLPPSAVAYVNGHGTGTASNDAMERAALRRVFGASPPRVSSTKSMVGHALGAAGALEAVATVLAMESSFVPPTCNFDASCVEDDEGFDFVPNRSVSVELPVAMSTSYGFGGNNAAVVFVRPDGPERVVARPASRRSCVVGLGATTERAVDHGMPWDALSRRARQGVTTRAWDRTDALARLGIGATDRALLDAGLALEGSSGRDVAVFFVSNQGPTRAVAFYLDVLANGPRSAVPWAFPSTTFNGPTGRACQTFGLRGPTATFAGGGATGLLVTAMAAGLIARGSIDVAVVVGAEDGLEHDGPAVGVAVVLEAVDHARGRGATPYALVDGAGVVDPGEPSFELRPAEHRGVDQDGHPTVDRRHGASGLAAVGVAASMLAPRALPSGWPMASGHREPHLHAGWVRCDDALELPAALRLQACAPDRQPEEAIA